MPPWFLLESRNRPPTRSKGKARFPRRFRKTAPPSSCWQLCGSAWELNAHPLDAVSEFWADGFDDGNGTQGTSNTTCARRPLVRPQLVPIPPDQSRPWLPPRPLLSASAFVPAPRRRPAAFSQGEKLRQRPFRCENASFFDASTTCRSPSAALVRARDGPPWRASRRFCLAGARHRASGMRGPSREVFEARSRGVFRRSGGAARRVDCAICDDGRTPRLGLIHVEGRETEREPQRKGQKDFWKSSSGRGGRSGSRRAGMEHPSRRGRVRNPHPSSAGAVHLVVWVSCRRRRGTDRTCLLLSLSPLPVLVGTRWTWTVPCPGGATWAQEGQAGAHPVPSRPEPPRRNSHGFRWG
eukprot:scaffold155_cov347-Pavlova_lutheri.AAC.64